MQFNEAVKIVEALADGYDPNTGECLSADNACQRPDVIQALFLVVQKAKYPAHLGHPATALANAGKPWSAEATGPLPAFTGSVTVAQLAKQEQRGVKAIQGYRNGSDKMPLVAPAMRAQPGV